MKKFFTLIAAVAMAASVNAQTENVMISMDGTYEGGQTLKSDNAQILLGGEGENFTKKKGGLASGAPYVAYLQGANNAKDADGADYNEEKKNVPATGCYYVFTASKNGKLEFGMQLGNGKAFFVVDGDTGENSVQKTLIDKSGAEVSLDANKVATKFYGTVNFDVVANKPYYIFCNGSKLAFYGYQFTPSTSTGISSAFVDAVAGNGAIYNLAGQQVSKSYKGIVVKNGKKFLNK